MILEILLNPFTLVIALIFSVIIMRDLLRKGSHLFAVQDCVYKHINTMAQEQIDEAWSGLSFDLKTTLTQAGRERRGGKNFVGSNRLRTFAKEHSTLYKEGQLTIDEVKLVGKARPPKEMYMVRLRSGASGTLRATVWVSRVPLRADGWSVEEVCVHPANGNVNQGETITGAKLHGGGKQSRFAKESKRRARARSDKSTA